MFVYHAEVEESPFTAFAVHIQKYSDAVVPPLEQQEGTRAEREAMAKPLEMNVYRSLGEKRVLKLAVLSECVVDFGVECVNR